MRYKWAQHPLHGKCLGLLELDLIFTKSKTCESFDGFSLIRFFLSIIILLPRSLKPFFSGRISGTSTLGCCLLSPVSGRSGVSAVLGGEAEQRDVPPNYGKTQRVIQRFVGRLMVIACYFFPNYGKPRMSRFFGVKPFFWVDGWPWQDTTQSQRKRRTRRCIEGSTWRLASSPAFCFGRCCEPTSWVIRVSMSTFQAELSRADYRRKKRGHHHRLIFGISKHLKTKISWASEDQKRYIIDLCKSEVSTLATATTTLAETAETASVARNAGTAWPRRLTCDGLVQNTKIRIDLSCLIFLDVKVLIFWWSDVSTNNNNNWLVVWSQFKTITVVK